MTRITQARRGGLEAVGPATAIMGPMHSVLPDDLAKALTRGAEEPKS